MNETKPNLRAAKSYLSLHCHMLNEINFFKDLRQNEERELLLKKSCIANYLLNKYL